MATPTTALLPEAGQLGVRALREGFELTQSEFAHMGGFSLRALQMWERGEEPTGSNLKTLREFQRLLPELRRYWPGRGELGAWLRAPNELWANSRPLDLISSGHVDMVWRLLYAADAGDLA